jgi:hypothetical protein
MDQQEKEFWDKLKRWHLDDIDICLANGANYAATKTMLSLIDALGGFYGGLVEKEVNEIYECKNCKKQKFFKKKKYLVRAGGGGRSKNIKTYNVDGVIYEESGSKKEFLNFVNNYINEFYKIKIKSKTKKWRAAEILYDHFRCGLIHEGHSKFGTGITNYNDMEIFKYDLGVPIALNIVCLRDLVRRAIFEFEKDVFHKKIKERVIRWEDRFNYLSELKL